jgi:hypothetical protein
LVPITPSNLTATPVSSTQINLAWTDASSNEDGFKVYRGTSSGAVTSLVATLGSGITNFQNTGLSASTTYYYKVTAFNSAGESAPSNVPSATTQGTSVITNTVYATADALIINDTNWIYSDDGTTSHYVDTPLPSSNNWVGTNWAQCVGCFIWSMEADFYSLIRFDTIGNTITGKTVNKALLRLFPNTIAGNISTYPFFTDNVLGISTDWNPNTITWKWANTINTITGLTNLQLWERPEISVLVPTSTVDPMEFDVTDIVQHWANGTWANYGIFISNGTVIPWASSTGGSMVTMFDSLETASTPSRRPKIYLEYR